MNTKHINKHHKALNCPFCGSKAIVTPFDNHKGYFAECSSDTCALWGFKTVLEEWNSRALTLKQLSKYLFDITPIYKTAKFYKAQEYVCKHCGANGESISSIRHKRNCEVKNILSVLA